MANHIFFELIQVAIGQRRCLSKVLTAEEWAMMHELFKKHALLGIGYVAIQKLPQEQWPPADIILNITVYATKIKAKNAELNVECSEVVRQMNHDGIGTVVIKGQENLKNYPEELKEYRNPGDIDVWTNPINDERLRINDCGMPIAVQVKDSVEYEYYEGVRGIVEYARSQRRLREDKSLFKPLYYHVEYHTDKGTEVEMHYRPSFLCSPVRNMRMQRWFKEQFDVCSQNKCLLGFPVLTPSVNVVYQLVHLYRHVFEGGVGLRQLMDYYFALRVWRNDVMECKDLQTQGMWSEGLGTPVMSASEVVAVLRSFGMAKFTVAVMYVLQTVFAMPDVYLLCLPDEKEGKFLLNEIMQAGNFGKYDDRIKHGDTKFQHAWEKTKHNLRLFTHYTEEVICEPFFRVYHWIWRKLELWRW